MIVSKFEIFKEVFPLHYLSIVHVSSQPLWAVWKGTYPSMFQQSWYWILSPLLTFLWAAILLGALVVLSRIPNTWIRGILGFLGFFFILTLLGMFWGGGLTVTPFGYGLMLIRVRRGWTLDLLGFNIFDEFCLGRCVIPFTYHNSINFNERDLFQLIVVGVIVWGIIKLFYTRR